MESYLPNSKNLKLLPLITLLKKSLQAIKLTPISRCETRWTNPLTGASISARVNKRELHENRRTWSRVNEREQVEIHRTWPSTRVNERERDEIHQTWPSTRSPEQQLETPHWALNPLKAVTKREHPNNLKLLGQPIYLYVRSQCLANSEQS